MGCYLWGNNYVAITENDDVFPKYYAILGGRMTSIFPIMWINYKSRPWKFITLTIKIIKNRC